MPKSCWSQILLWTALASALSGCSSVPENAASVRQQLTNPPLDVQREHDPKPMLQLEPPSRSGNADSYVVFGRRYRVRETSEGYREQGLASWYGRDFHGRKTSSGPAYDMFDLTAAHKSLPIPSYVRVINLENGRNVVVKVNDRGPFVGKRLIDLSYAAARQLDMLGKGTAQVEVIGMEPYQLLPELAARRATERLAHGESSNLRKEPQGPIGSAGPVFDVPAPRLTRNESRPALSSDSPARSGEARASMPLAVRLAGARAERSRYVSD